MAPRRVRSVKAMEEAWEAFKEECDNQNARAHGFSSKNSEFVSTKLKKSITYTIEGFCVFLGMGRSRFYDTYAKDERYRDIVTRIKEECEVDARRKFELELIPTQLAGLWMSKHGYSTKEKTVIASDATTNILDALSGKADAVFSDPDDDVENP